MRFRAPLVSFLVILVFITACGTTSAPGQPATPAKASNPFGKINHFIVLYQENWSFDSLYGNFPGAEGISQADPVALKQITKDG